MENQLVLKMAFSVIGGLGIFLLGMKNMSEGLQAVAGSRLRNLIGAVTNNRFFATGIGLLVTCVIQSSSVTTVMVVGFVNSSLMTLTQAIGVIMGANIGTTITGWILVLAIGKYGLPIIGIAAFFYLFSKSEKVRYISMAIMGIGMIFFGLELMKNGFKPIRSLPEFEAWFHAFSATSYLGIIKCALAGCILTMIVQSSSATLGITMGLAATGVIGFETAAALVLGENIGTTITALLASLGTGTNARRAAYAHAVFNIIGVMWIILIFPIYIVIVKKFMGVDPNAVTMVKGVETYPYVQAGIAVVHSGFNIANTLIFLPFVPVLAGLLEKVVPKKPYKEPPRLTRLDIRMLSTPMMVIEQSRNEILHMGENVHRMLECLREILDEKEGDKDKDDLVKKIFHREEVLDVVQKEIATFLTRVLSNTIPHRVSMEAREQLRMADEYESVSDYIKTILELYLRLQKAGLNLSSKEKSEILELHDMVSSYFDLVNTANLERHKEIISKAKSQGDLITEQFYEFRNRHLARLSETQVEPLLSLIYGDMLNAYRRVRDHILNIAETLAGEK
jgi:phosphate:Na+ symporter